MSYRPHLKDRLDVCIIRSSNGGLAGRSTSFYGNSKREALDNLVYIRGKFRVVRSSKVEARLRIMNIEKGTTSKAGLGLNGCFSTESLFRCRV